VRFSTRALGSMAGIERTKAELRETGGMRMGFFQKLIPFVSARSAET
jgi:hypothetical protein